MLDEADRLVDKSFVADINYIFSRLPLEKQVIMSSATYPDKTKESITKYLQSAQHICPHADSILLGIDQRITFVKHNVNIVKQTKFRFEELLKILSRKPFKQCLIFCNYQTRVAEVGKMLKKEKWPAEQLYGQQNQTRRLEALKTLQDYGCRILVATDLAARGIDASNVDLVINFEPAFEWQTYLHRIGRAGRFGSYGIAVTILSEGQEENKFKTMLGEIKGSINLKKFWDDEFNVTDVNLDTTNSSESELNPPNHKEQIFQKLWDTLTSPSKKDPKEMESFETLCSFKERKETEIKPFSDLLNSFNIHEVNNNMNDISPYQCLSQPDIPTAEYYAVINNIHTKEDMSTKGIIVDEKCQREDKRDEYNAFNVNNEILNVKYKELNINSKISIATAGDDIELDNLENGDNINNNYKFEDLEFADALHITQLPTVFESSKDRKSINSQLFLAIAEENIERKDHLQNGNYGDTVFDVEDPELTDSLRAAGLPTAFNSRKFRNSNKKNIYKTNKKFIENSSCRPLLPKAFKQNNSFNNNVGNNYIGTFEATCEVTNKHSFRNDPVNKYSRALEFNEHNTTNYKNEPNCFNNTSQSKYNYKHTFTNPVQGSEDDDYILENKVCDNISQYQRSIETEYKQDPVKQHNSNTKALYEWTTNYGKQYDTHKLSGPSKPKCSKETSDDDTESDSFDEPALSPEYVNWYKTLKFRTLHVLLAVYVEELSKLKMSSSS